MDKRRWFFTFSALFIVFVLAIVSIYYGGIFGCGGGSSSGGATAAGEETFTNGGQTLKSSISTSGSTKTVTVTNSSGTTVLTLVLTTTTATLSAPGYPDSSYTFRRALSSLPTDYAANRMWRVI